jgi:PleD family two-component response regulator
LRQGLQTIPLLQGQAGVTVSIGLAQWVQGNGESALQNANRALYAAKAAGRNRTHMADASRPPVKAG